ncbi:hypothetical protein BY996DRAFT_7556211 [Phakopsora pachyrhizi]|nr:hypothetical protein BY996DRAFT_7556211 [Phakopsora pachyrhizi]
MDVQSGALEKQIASFSEKDMFSCRGWDEKKPFDSSLDPESQLNWFNSQTQQQATESKTLYQTAQSLPKSFQYKEIENYYDQPLSPLWEHGNTWSQVFEQNHHMDVQSGFLEQQMPSFPENDMFNGARLDEKKPVASLLEPESRLNWFNSQTQKKETESQMTYGPVQSLSKDSQYKHKRNYLDQPLSPTLEREKILNPVIGKNKHIKVGSRASYQQIPSLPDIHPFYNADLGKKKFFDSSLEPKTRLSWFNSQNQQKETDTKTSYQTEQILAKDDKKKDIGHYGETTISTLSELQNRFSQFNGKNQHVKLEKGSFGQQISSFSNNYLFNGSGRNKKQLSNLPLESRLDVISEHNQNIESGSNTFNKRKSFFSESDQLKKTVWNKNQHIGSILSKESKFNSVGNQNDQSVRIHPNNYHDPSAREKITPTHIPSSNNILSDKILESIRKSQNERFNKLKSVTHRPQKTSSSENL